jgi:O-antigen ligase
VAMVIAVGYVLERPDRARVQLAALLVPLLLAGMLANGRRLAWVMLGASFGVAYLLSPWRAWKRRLTLGVLALLPIVALYVAVGWNRGSTLFAPVRTLRSLADSSVDPSTLWREIEDYNICASIRAHPILGIGLGGEYTESVANADISQLYPDYRRWPHNSVLGLMLLAGVLGFTAIWLLHAAVVFLAVRSYRFARGPEDRVAAIACIASTIACITTAFGDTGPNFIQYRLFWALALVVSAKLAVATGAWPARGRTPATG